MHTKLRLLELVPVLATVVALTGCAAAIPAAPGPTASSSTPTPTPTPTASAASAPGSRVPIGCADLLSTDSVSSIAGAAPKVYQDQNTAPGSMEAIAQLQFGALSCLWQGDAGSPSAELRVSVAPDSGAAFESRFDAIMAYQDEATHPAATENVAGDKSGYWCANEVGALGAHTNLPICDAEVLVSNYWVSIEVDTVDGLSRPQLTTAIAKAMVDVAGRLAAAGPAPAQWIAPATTPPAFCSAPGATAKVRSILGDPALAATSTTAVSLTASTIGLVGDTAACSWRSHVYNGVLEITLLAGGAWALPTVKPVVQGDVSYGRTPYTSPTVTGATATRLSCGGGVCDAFLAIGSTAAEIVYKDQGTARNPAVLAGFAQAISAS